MYPFLQGIQKRTLACFHFLSDQSSSESNTNSHSSQNKPKTLQNPQSILICLFFFAIYVLNLLQMKGSMLINLIGCFIFMAIVIVQISPEHKSLKIQSLLRFVLLKFYIVYLALSVKDEGSFTAWLGILTFPTLIYLLTRNLNHFFIQNVIHILFFNILYQPQIKEFLITKSTEDIAATLNNSLRSLFILNMLLVSIAHVFGKDGKSNKLAKNEGQKIHPPQEPERQILLGFSHELRNHINSLMGNIKLANLEQLSEKTTGLLLNAEICGELLINLVNNILDVGKIEINELEISHVPIRLHTLMEDIWKVCSEMIQRKNLKGRMRVQKQIPKVLNLDYYRITQIVINLVSNAVKFTTTGLIDVSIEWVSNTDSVVHSCFEPVPFNDENDQDEGLFEKKQAISVLSEEVFVLNSPFKRTRKNPPSSLVERNKGILKITVTDTGCGISKSDVEKLFTKKPRSESGSGRRASTSLGLYVTKELCKKMDGDIKVFSREGKGSSFIICIPIDPVVSETRHFLQIESIKNIVGPKNLKALVVDDIPLNNIILKDFFVKMGVEVVDSAENGESACEKYKNILARRDQLNIVTMDLDMPIMDGKAAAKVIRNFEIENDLEPCLLIITSGNSIESEIKECMDPSGEIRADAFLKKPLSMEDLIRVVMSNYSEGDRRKSRFHTV